ncbi:hypothetical protein LTR28_002512, partial [Elasticomyces elasticus]
REAERDEQRRMDEEEVDARRREEEEERLRRREDGLEGEVVVDEDGGANEDESADKGKSGVSEGRSTAVEPVEGSVEHRRANGGEEDAAADA